MRTLMEKRHPDGWALALLALLALTLASGNRGAMFVGGLFGFCWSALTYRRGGATGWSVVAAMVVSALMILLSLLLMAASPAI